MAVEVFANQPAATITSGGGTAPASGTVETWTASSWAAFAQATTGSTQYHIYDETTGKSSELILVENTSGTSATVVRGAEGTTPVAHSAPFTVTQAITAGWLTGLVPTTTPEAWGAAGNGTTDDTAAVAAAITAAGTGGLLYFARTYLISSSVAPLTGQRWYGPGTLLLAPATTVPIVNATSALSGVRFGEGLTFDGNQANQTAAGNSLVHFTSPTRLVIEDCAFQNSYRGTVGNSTPAVQIRLPQYSKVRGCYVYNCGYGITLGALNTDSTPMYGNSVTDCDINTTSWDGVFLTENLGTVGSVTPGGYLRGTTVENCRFTQVGDASVEVGSGNVGAVVSGCTMDNTSNTSTGNNGILVRDSQDVTISGCTVRGYLKSAAAAIYFLNLNGTGGNGKKNQNITVDGCIVDTVDYGINDAAGVTGLTVSGSTFNTFAQTSAGAAGIKLSNTSTFTVTGCTLANGSGTPGSNEGLEFVSAHDGTVSGCNFFNNRGNDALIVNSASFDITVTGNRFGPSNTGHAVRILDTGSHDITVTDNDLSGNSTGNGVVLNAAPGANISIRGNNGVNPFGPETVTVPATAVPVAIAQHDRTYYVTNGAASSTFALTPTVAVLSSALSTGGPITSLPVNALNAAIASGTVVVSSGSNTQSFTTTGAAVGATSIPVTSATPGFAYPAGSAVVAGTGITITLPASAVVPIRVPAGSALAPAYSSAPTWVVEGE